MLILFMGAAVSVEPQAGPDPCAQDNYRKRCYANLGKQAESQGNPRRAYELYDKAMWQPTYGNLASPLSGWSSEDRRIHADIMERVIHLRDRLDPPPAIPISAYEAMERGVNAVERSAGLTGLSTAREQFEYAAMLAPWWPEAQRNLAHTYEALGRRDDAALHFRLYLLAAPAADDAAQVQAKISELQR